MNIRKKNIRILFQMKARLVITNAICGRKKIITQKKQKNSK